MLLNKSGTPLFRFIYENRGPRNANEGLTTTFSFSLNGYGAPAMPPPASSDASITAIFGTGGDDLRGGGDNVNLVIRFKSSKPAITLSNVNASRNWRNLSEKSFTKVLPNTAGLDFNDIKEIELRHTGGGGIGADNWYLDKFKLTITNGSETKILVDRIAAPIHYFTGDARRKTIKVE